MKALQINDVIQPVGEHPLLDGLWRVLHINRDADLAVAIPIDYLRGAEKPGKKKRRRLKKAERRAARRRQQNAERHPEDETENPQWYWRGPKKRSLCALEAALNENRIVKTAVELPRLVTMSDEEIQERYPPRPRDPDKKPTKRKDGRIQRPRRLPRTLKDGTPLSATLDVRDERLQAIRPILDHIKKVGSAVFETGELAALVKARSEEGFKPAFVFDALHRYLALGCGDNALLGNLERCGGSGPRHQTQRIGRPLGLYKKGVIDDPGKFLTDVDKEKITVGWRTYVESEKHSRRDAWMLFLGAFYSSGTKLHQGVATPILLPVQQRPSYAQFCYWGPRGEGNKSAFEVQLKPNEWEQTYRALFGTARATIPGVGHTGFMDSTRTNTVLVSMMKRLNSLGTGHRILIHDAFSDVVPPPYCGLEAPSEATALLAIFRGASSVVPLAERLNVDIGEDQIPSIFFGKYLVDNTDLRTRGAMKVVKQCGSSIEYVEVNRAERKGPVESGHHEFNSHLDDAMDGSNHGRQTERGEEAAAVSACWTYFEYFAELLLAIAYHNTQADASAVFESHPCRAEMARAGVANTRMAIYQWARQNNRDRSSAFDIRVLRSHLLPCYRARVFRNGARLMRPDRGNKREYIAGLRFLGPRLTQAKLLERAGRGEEIYLDLRIDKYDPNRASFTDDAGYHELINVVADPIMEREATLADYLAHQDDEHFQELLRQNETDQAAFDYANHRGQKNLEHRAAKQAEIEREKEAGRKVTKKSLKTGLKAHRAAEVELLKGQLDEIDPSRRPAANKMKVGKVAEAPTDAANAGAPSTATAPLPSDAQSAVRRHRQLRKAA